MGVQLTEILKIKETSIEALKGKTLAVDAPNHLYQFLSNIRQPDGNLLTDSNGNVTSHLIGLLSRTTALLRAGLKLAYVFDGAVPELKKKELLKRRGVKEEAEKKYLDAQERRDEVEMRKQSARTSRLTKEMIAEAKKLLAALGVPVIEAPAEGEAQAARMAWDGACYAVASQDADCLLFGAPVVIRNLSLGGKRKQTGKLSYGIVSPEVISLSENLSHLGVSQEQLIALAMLVGTDYNIGGVKGIGPKKALKLVKEQKELGNIFAAAKWNEHFSLSWEQVYETIAHMPTTDAYELRFAAPDREAVAKLLCDEHNFSETRIEKALADLAEGEKHRQQKGLLEFG
jgi:flap endonuclease-1